MTISATQARMIHALINNGIYCMVHNARNLYAARALQGAGIAKLFKDENDCLLLVAHKDCGLYAEQRGWNEQYIFKNLTLANA